jgi:putative ABC transport system permease protein
MILTLAIKNLFHDRVRLAVTLVGILFSVVLVAVQLGLYLGARKMIVAMVEKADAELWVMPFGTKSFEEGGVLLKQGDRHATLSVPGVANAVPVIVSFAEWRKPGGGSTTAIVVGANPEDGGIRPWNVIAGSETTMSEPGGVAVDRTYMADLGVTAIGQVAQLEQGRVRVTAITEGIRSFTMAPFVFTTLNRARGLIGAPQDGFTYLLVKLTPGASEARVLADLKARMPDQEVLTKAEFRDRSLKQWLFSTGAGVALIGGALLGLLVGTVIVAQTLYSSTKDHLSEFATLRALGSSAGYIHRVILTQAAFSAVLGYALGMAIALVITSFSEATALPLEMTPWLAASLFFITIGMCAVSAISAILKVTKIDPAMVFSR